MSKIHDKLKLLEQICDQFFNRIDGSPFFKYHLGTKFYNFLSGEDKEVGGIDLDLLHQQKQALIETIKDIKALGGEELDHNAQVLEGLVSFLDAFQDMMVDELGLWEFPITED